MQVSGSLNPAESGPFWRCVKDFNSKREVQQEQEDLKSAEVEFEEAEAPSQNEAAARFYTAQLQVVHTQQKRTLKEVLDAAEEILAHKAERDAASLDEVQNKHLRLEGDKWSNNKEGILSATQVRVQGDASPLDLCVLWEVDLVLPTISSLRAAVNLTSDRGAVVLLVAARADSKQHAAVETSIAALVQDGRSLPKRVLLKGSEEYWAILVLPMSAHGDLEESGAASTLAQKLWLGESLIEKMPDFVEANQRARLYPESPQNRHFALVKEKGDPWYRKLLASLGLDSCAIVQPDPELGQVMQIVAERVKQDSRLLLNSRIRRACPFIL